MLTICAPLSDADVQAYATIASAALGFSLAQAAPYFTAVGHENLRLAYQGDTVAGGLAAVPMGQWFGGRTLPMAGIAAVAVAPEHRGTGVGSRLMRVTLSDLRDKGFPLAVLYAATQPIYRRVGFELAGYRTRFQMPLAAIDGLDRSLTVQPVSQDDVASLEAIYTVRARQSNGHLLRSTFFWQRIFQRPAGGEPVQAYMILNDDTPEGYVVFTHEPGGAKMFDLVVRDMVALTQGAARRIWTLLADHRSSSESVRWVGPPNEPVMHVLAEYGATVSRWQGWMLRLLDVPAALAGRRYPANLRMTVHLEVMDPTLGWNDGRFVMQLSKGTAKVDPGGDAKVRITVNALAALFTGYLSPWDLKRLGTIDGPDDSLALLAQAFAGPIPWMPDFF
jgi:predicted acetyltransferase